jgi:hypothetical protein
LVINFGIDSFSDKGVFDAHESNVWIDLIMEESDEDYTLLWAKPDEGYFFTNYGFIFACLFNKHKNREMVVFKDGLEMNPKTLKKLIWEVPLTEYKLLPSNKYFNCWRASNYFTYAFAQLRDCMNDTKHKDTPSTALRPQNLVRACLPKIGENLTLCEDYDRERVDWNVTEGLFHIAAKEGNLADVNDLLKKDVNVKAVDRKGRTALDLAEKGGHSTVIETLKNKYYDQAFIAPGDDSGLTPINAAENTAPKMTLQKKSEFVQKKNPKLKPVKDNTLQKKIMQIDATLDSKKLEKKETCERQRQNG